MRKFLLYGHGGACNHGAEAIVRTTVPLLRQAGGRILLSTHFPDQDRAFGLDKLVDELIPANLSFVPQERAAESWAQKSEFAKRIYADALAAIDAETVCIGIGGDNYCYPNWYRQSIFHYAAKHMGAKSILWGCSIEPRAINEEMRTVLSTHDHIYVRESCTREALAHHGITRQVELRPDPAFLLPPEPVELPRGFCPGGTVALNVSPLVLRRSEGLLAQFVQTARTLLRQGEALLLLPHVTMPADDDRMALSELAAALTADERRRVCALEEHNAAQLKYLISQCELLVCCRTHASIAAYSTGTPVVVVGYSVKSEGIGRDLGMSPWVLPLERSAELPELASQAWYMRGNIRETIRRRMTSY